MSYICASCRASSRLASRRAVNSARAYSSAIEHGSKQVNNHASEEVKPLVSNQVAVSAIEKRIAGLERIQLARIKQTSEKGTRQEVLTEPAAEVEFRSLHPSFKIRKVVSSTPGYEKLPDRIDELLAKPSWSVRSLLPDPDTQLVEDITPDQLHHLLRLSALPQPKSPEEEAEMLKTLHTQLHFVRDIQNVDTEDVEPLQSIRDETEEGLAEATISWDTLKKALRDEEVIGRSKRPRRKRGQPVDTAGIEDWDVLSAASEKVVTPGGNYFIVRSGKENAEPPQQQDQQVNVLSTDLSTAPGAAEGADLREKSQLLVDFWDQEKAHQ